MSEEKNPSTSAQDKVVEVPDKFKTLVEQVEKMSVLDLAELVKILEEKFGVSAAAPAMMMPAAAGGGAAPAVEEKIDFNIELTEAGGTKISVIKVVKEIPGLGLADAKALVDAAPKVIKEKVAIVRLIEQA